MKGGVMKRVILFSLLISFLSLFFFSIIFVGGTSGENDRSSYGYQLVNYNDEEKSFSFGIVTTPFKIEQNSFFSHQHDIPSYTLISNFGEQEYICTSSCYCEERDKEFRRLSSGLVIERGLKYLLVAISLALANKYALEYFNEKCIEEMKDVCSTPTSIKSEIENCEEIPQNKDLSAANEEGRGQTNENPVDDTPDSEDNRMRRKFLCEGNCVVNENIGKKYWKTRSYALKYGCETLKRTGEVEIAYKENDNSDQSLEAAKKEFIISRLEMFCRASSQSDSQDVFHQPERPCSYTGKRGNTWKDFRTQGQVSSVPLCVAFSSRSVSGNDYKFINPSVKCRKV